MKKYLVALTFVAGLALMFSSFGSSTTPSDTDKLSGEEDEVSNSDVWDYMHKNVFKKLNTLVSYDKERVFSRCPSGFSQNLDEQLSDNHTLYGTITYAQGCSRDDYCLYKIDWDKKETFLKKDKKDEYLSLDNFVKQEKTKIARI